MLRIDLPPSLQRRLSLVIQDSYHGDVQAAMSAFLVLHEKYGWKEQLYRDISVIRTEVQRCGGISEKTVNDAIQRYRAQLDTDLD